MNHLLSAHGKNSGNEPGPRVHRYLGRIVVGCCLLLALASAARAVQPYVPKSADPILDPWRWEKIPELEGKSPRCMVGGKDGAMWFGLPTEVVRYDGENWQSFPVETGATPNVLCRSNNGVVYAGTNRGIDRLTGGKWEHVFPRDRAQAPAIGNMLVASDGSLWAGAADFILQVKGSVFTLFANAARSDALRQAYPEASVVVIPDAISLPATAATAGPTVLTAALHETQDGMIWWGLVSGDIFRHDPHIAKRDDPAAWRLMSGGNGYHKGGAGTDQRVILQTKDGLVWVGSGQHDVGVNRYDPAKDTWSYLSLSEKFGGDNIVHSIIETRDGSVLLGGFARLIRYKDGKWTAYATPEVPLSSTRISLYESQAGDLYVLGLGDDVQKMDYKESRWRKYEGLNFQCETPDGRQWFVSVDDGVVSFDGKSWQRYGVEDGLMSAPYTLLCTRQGQVWVAGVHESKAATAWLAPDGWHRRTFETIRPQFGFIIDYRAVAESADGSLWFGCYINGINWPSTNGGIIQYDPRRGPPEDDRAWTNRCDTNYRVSSGITQTTDGSIYTGNYGAIRRFDGREWVPVPLLPASPNNVLTSSLDGRLWIGQRGNGLLCYDGTTVTTYTTKDGLKSNVITALLCDRDNHLWVGSSNGISYYDGKEWTTDVFLDAKVTINSEGGGFRQSADGALWINQCSRSWIRRVLPENQNHAAIARSFSTVRYLRERIAPRVEIVSSVTQVSQPGNTVIAWRGQSPWWRTQESDLRFSQRLDDGPWSKFTAETSHVFLQIPPGSHRVEVRVRDRDSNVSPVPARVEFKVLPPIWQEPWFIALLAVLTGAVVTQTIRASIRGLRVRRSNRALAAEIEERKKTEAELAEKTTRLEHEIDERKRMEQEIETTHKQLLLASREAGMAEVATSVLHNVGNVLNSVNVSATLLVDKIKQFKISGLVKASDLLAENAQAPGFLSTDERGKQLPGYLKNLSEHMAGTQETCVKELESLSQNIEHIKDIVAMQQSYSQLAGVSDTVKISEMLEDAIRINAGALTRHAVALVRDFQFDAAIEIEKHKVLQILVNLIRNAKYACDEGQRADKRLIIRTVLSAPGRIQIQVIDNGVGIPPENMLLIFNHGFTTRQAGHGFGLHSSANTAKELGGSLIAQSAGPGQGATFILELPFDSATDRTE